MDNTNQRFEQPSPDLFSSYPLNIAHSVKELHHHVSITAGCRHDLDMWFRYLEQWNGISFFIDDNFIKASDYDFSRSMARWGQARHGWFIYGVHGIISYSYNCSSPLSDSITDYLYLPAALRNFVEFNHAVNNLWNRSTRNDYLLGYNYLC